jgi:predicted O-methyltransferase YrrM
MLERVHQLLSPRRASRLALHWRRRAGWLGSHLNEAVPTAPRKQDIERAARSTNALGPQPLHQAYNEQQGAARLPDAVRSASGLGDLYAWLVEQRRPHIVVEFGSAFGVSGMYFTTGMEAARCGHLYSFEINREWADTAERNIRSISNRVTLTRAAFEDSIDVIPGQIDIAFVDGIHTYQFVKDQYAILEPRLAPGGIVIFDDINFPKPGCGMWHIWEEIASGDSVAAAVEVDGHVGLIEHRDGSNA